MRKLRCYNKHMKSNLNLLFIFLSLSFRGHPGIVWSTIPGLSMSGGRTASSCTMRLLSLLPFAARYRFILDYWALHVRKAGQPIRAQYGYYRLTIGWSARYRSIVQYRVPFSGFHVIARALVPVAIRTPVQCGFQYCGRGNGFPRRALPSSE